MADGEVTVEGLAETMAYLDNLPPIIVKAAFRAALEAAVAVVINAMRPRIPRSNPSGIAAQSASEASRHPRPLSEAVIQRVQVEAEGGTGTIGFASDQGNIPLWLEEGHKQVTHKPALKEVGFVDPRPFMGPAVDASWEEAVDAFTETFKKFAAAGVAGYVVNDETAA